jgi:hypothetical protein
MLRVVLTALVAAWVVSLVRLVRTWREPAPLAPVVRLRRARSAA